jgi:hypothetical protein
MFSFLSLLFCFDRIQKKRRDAKTKEMFVHRIRMQCLSTSSSSSCSGLYGTVKYYNRHVFCSGMGSAFEWTGGILEKIPSTNIHEAAKAIESLKTMQFDLKIKLSALDLQNELNSSDIWILPEQIVFRNVNYENANQLLVQYFTTSLSSFASVEYESFKDKTMILICGHQNRDSRCGAAGRVLYEQFNNLAHRYNVSDKVLIGLTSHIGGHKYAGNVIIYPNGDWFGRVDEFNVEKLFKEYVLGNHNLVHLHDNWRGRIGLKLST